MIQLPWYEAGRLMSHEARIDSADVSATPSHKTGWRTVSYSHRVAGPCAPRPPGGTSKRGVSGRQRPVSRNLYGGHPDRLRCPIPRWVERAPRCSLEGQGGEPRHRRATAHNRTCLFSAPIRAKAVLDCRPSRFDLKLHPGHAISFRWS